MSKANGVSIKEVNLQPHGASKDSAVFRAVESQRRSTNLESNVFAKNLMISHSWRNSNTQELKMDIIDYISTPQEEGGPGLTYWADFLDLQAEGPVPWRKEIEEGIRDASKVGGIYIPCAAQGRGLAHCEYTELTGGPPSIGRSPGNVHQRSHTPRIPVCRW